MKRQKQKYREKHSRKIQSMIERESRKEGQRERDMKRERKREQKAEVDLSFISAKRIGRISSLLECGDRKGPGGQQYVTIQNAAILYCRPACAHVDSRKTIFSLCP
jgi:hypothetical protein